jgi:hypothetical protein
MRFRKGVAILVIGTALSLPLSACTGLLVGLHKNEIPALTIGASRLLGALTVNLQVYIAYEYHAYI